MTNGQSWLGTVGLLLLGAAVGAGMAAAVSFLSRRPDPARQRRGRRLTLVFVIVVALLVVVAIGRFADPRLAEAALGATAARVVATVPDIFLAVVIIGAAIFMGSALRGLSHRLLQPVRPEWAPAAGMLAYWSIIAVALIVAASQVGIAVAVLERLLLIVAGGLILTTALGLGLGSRQLFGALIAGRHVAQFLEVGDEVEVDGLRGKVLAIGHASVRVAVGDAEAAIPNGRFFDGAVLVHQRGREPTTTAAETAPPLADIQPTPPPPSR